MGCDIHLHQEVKINGQMAGVRGEDTEAISVPKGLPEDVTYLTNFDHVRWDADAHSASWLGAEEIAKLYEWYGKRGEFKDARNAAHGQFGYLFGNGWDGFLKYPTDREDGVEDIRFVFWFDN